MDPAEKHLKSQRKMAFFNVHSRKSEQADITEIEERSKGPWIAHGKDSQGRPLRQFVRSGTKL